MKESKLNRIYIFGGNDIKEGEIGTMYSIDPEAMDIHWKKTELNGELPDKIWSHTANIFNNLIFIIGGISLHSSSNKIYEINIENQISKQVSIVGKELPPLDSHTSILYSSDNQNYFIYIFGGYHNLIKSNHIYIFDISKYEIKELKAKGKKPCPRSLHSAILYKESIYIFGGSDANNGILDDFWSFNILTGTWEELSKDDGSRPTGRKGHSASVISNRMFIIGGSSESSKEFNSVYEYNLDKKEWRILFPDTGDKPSEFKMSTKSAFKIKSPRHLSMSRQNSSKNCFSTNFSNNPPQLRNYDSPNIVSEKFLKTYNNFDLEFKKYIFHKPSIKRKIKFYAAEEKKAPYSPTFSAMKNSFIFKMDISSNIKKADLSASNFISNSRKNVGIYPCKRDGHATIVCNNKLYIFGGDRNQMSFNDLYCYDPSLIN